MVYSGVDADQALQFSYDADNQALRTSPSAGTLVTEAFDYVAGTYPDGVTEVYTYKSGGASGTTVAIVTVVYTSSAKALITSVTKA